VGRFGELGGLACDSHGCLDREMRVRITGSMGCARRVFSATQGNPGTSALGWVRS
jgi:hypothetical protein